MKIIIDVTSKYVLQERLSKKTDNWIDEETYSDLDKAIHRCDDYNNNGSFEYRVVERYERVIYPSPKE